MLNLAVIGLGNRGSGLVATLRRVYPDINLAAVADPDEERSRRCLHRRELADEGVRYFPDADRLLEHADDYDALLIASSCNTHTPLAVKAAATGLPLYLEKPVAVSYEQVVALRDAYRGRESSVVVSFPLRLTPLFASVMDVVRSGRLGTINQVQAVHNIPYGGELFSSPFYREYDVGQGLWLQKATHDFDCLNQILGRPTGITAMMSRRVYGGHMPHDLRCSACDRTETCLESPQNVARRGDDGGVGAGDHLCLFTEGIRHQDAGSAIIMYEDGAHASYGQNFISRRTAATRGAIITGYHATASFDWYTDTVRVIEHHTDRVDQYRVTAARTDHLGGDQALARNFVDVCLGRDESRSDLNAGLLSAAMCLAARESAHRQEWRPVGDVHDDAFPHASGPAHPTPADLEPVA